MQKSNGGKWLLGVFIALFVACVAILICCVLTAWLFLLSIPRRPSDAEIRNWYYNHKATLVEIVEMAKEDSGKVTRISSNFAKNDSFLSREEDPETDPTFQARLAKYRKLFEKINLPNGIEINNSGGVEFLYFTSGLSVSGSRKGVLYSTSPIENYFKDQSDADIYNLMDDKETFRGKFSSTVYRIIEPNWYIYQNYED